MPNPGHRLTVAIVGRPNVGKSTLFNRLVGRRLALVDDTPGVTRDRREADADIGDIAATVIDTAGFEEAAPGSLSGRMRAQTEAAVADAGIILFVVDARTGLTPVDRQFADLLRRAGKPVVLIANKSESSAAEPGYYDAFALGFGEPVAVSAEHGIGMGELIGAVAAAAEDIDMAGEETRGEVPLKIAIIGRPNAGKSTLVNRLIGEERLLTGPEAGITRDAISVDWRWRDRPVRLVDTAGLRRKSRIHDKLEKLSVADALRAVRFAEVAVLVIDVQRPFEKQDLQLADLVVREGRALVLALAKWDLVQDTRTRLSELREAADRLLPQARGVPLVPLSAFTGHGLDRLMKAVAETYETWNRRISTGALNRWLADIVDRHPPPAPGGRRVKLRYITQASARPPTFAVFCSRPDALPDAYRRYLVNGLRESFGLTGVPLRVHFRKGDNPYAARGGR